MKSAPFDYAAPDSLDEVLGLLASTDESRIIAGGQSLVPLMAMRLSQPELLVDLRNVVGLSEIEVIGDGVVVGAMVSQAALAARNDEVHPLLPEAISLIAHAQIRNRGTVVGSLAHADPAAELPAVAVALDARLRVRGAGGERTIAASEFFMSYFSTALEPGEVVLAVELPAARPGEGWAIEEVTRRHGDFALAGVVTRLLLDDAGLVREARIVPFAAGDHPVAVPEAAEALVGAAPSAEAVAEAARRVAAAVEPSSDLHASARYRRHALEVLTGWALTRAVGVATSSMR